MSAYAYDPGINEWLPSKRFSRCYDNVCVRAWQVIHCSVLYYESGRESPWTDNMYDTACKLIADDWRGLTFELAGILGSAADLRATGFHIRPTPEQKKRAAEVFDAMNTVGRSLADLERGLDLAREDTMLA